MNLETLSKFFNENVARVTRLIGRSFMFDRTMQRDLFMEKDDNLVVSEYIDLNYYDIIMDGDSCEITFVEEDNGYIWHAYGGFQGASETISIAAVDTWTHVTNGTNNLWTGIEADGMTLSGDVITMTNAGDYTGVLSITFEGSNNKDFKFRIYNNTQAVQLGYTAGATGMGAGNLTNVSIPLYLECNAGDELQVEVECTTDASDPTLHDAIFYMSFLHN